MRKFPAADEIEAKASEKTQSVNSESTQDSVSKSERMNDGRATIGDQSPSEVVSNAALESVSHDGNAPVDVEAFGGDLFGVDEDEPIERNILGGAPPLDTAVSTRATRPATSGGTESARATAKAEAATHTAHEASVH